MLAIVIAVFAVCVYALQAKIYQKNWKKGLSVELQFSKEAVYKNETVDLLEIVENKKRLPLPTLTVKFESARALEALDHQNSAVSDHYYRNDIFTMGAMRRTTRQIPFHCNQRGFYEIHDIMLISADLFLRNETFEERKSDAYLYVYPERIKDETGKRLLSRMTGEVLSKRHQEEDPFEFRGIREYSFTDEMRTINWKATARTGDLKVNMKNYTSLKAVRIYLNIDDTGILKHHGVDEYAIMLAASLAERFLESGMRVLLETNGRDLQSNQRISVRENGGSAQLSNILRSLARLDVEKETVPFVETFGKSILENTKGVYTILITSEVREDYVELVKSLQKKKAEYALIQVVDHQMNDADVWSEITKNYEIIEARE